MNSAAPDPTPVTAVPSLRQRKKDATHQAIVDAAWDLFAAQGYDATSVNDIAARANVAPRTFFRYFSTKEAVVYPEFDQSLERVRSAFLERPADEPLMTSLILAFETLTDSMSADNQRNEARMAMMKESGPALLGEYFRKRLTDQVTLLVLERDAAHPEVHLRAKLASGIIGLIMDTSREHWMETGATESLPDVGHRCMTMVTELLAR